MGDKISQLPAATTVDGTELVPIVQAGTTKSVTGTILRNPTGSAGGDLAGSYPNPTLAAVTTAQAGVGSQSAIPVVSIDAKGRVVALSTVATSALTTNQIAGLSTAAGAALATAGAVGLSTFAARADHQHARPTPAEIGALGATAAAGGDLTGNYPNPTLAAITTAQSNAGSATVIPVVSIDVKGRVTALSTVAFAALTTNQIAGLSTAAGAALTTTAIAGLSTFAARADHTHVFPTAGQVGALGATAAAGGDLVGNYPNPTLAAITTAQSNVGSGTLVPVLSIDAKGRVTALGTTPISGSAGGTVTSITAGTGLSGGTITSSGTVAIASITTAQSNVGSATQIPVLSINAQGQVTALSSVAASGGGAALTTNPAAALSTQAIAGLSTEAARADHRHLFPTAAEVGALGATAAASGDLTGNYPAPTLAAITTAQSNVGSSTVIPILSIDAKGRVTSLSSVSAASSASTDDFRNRIINGDMIIDQRNSGGATANTINGYTVDRWQVTQTNTGKLIAQQNAGAVTPPVGFTKYLGVTSQSAYTVLASDYYLISHAIEGQNVRDFAWGTANATAITLSFRVYSSLTGTFGGSIMNSAGNRSYPFSYTITSANSWTTINVTIPGDTTGTWLTTNGVGMYVYFGLGVGTNFSTTAGAWISSMRFSASGAQSVVGVNAATFYITGVQLERGSTATSFETLPFATQLQLCQRYYDTITMWVPATGDPRQVFYKTSMRALPTFSGGGTGFTPTNQTVNGASVVQITAANQTLVFLSEL